MRTLYIKTPKQKQKQKNKSNGALKWKIKTTKFWSHKETLTDNWVTDQII